MKITFLTPHVNISGGVKIILGYADKLAKKGHSVTIICPQAGFVKRKVKRIPVIYPKRAVMNFLRYRPNWMRIAANIKYVPSYNERYIPNGDIIVATAWQTAFYVNEYASRKGRKFYLFQHYERLFADGCNDVDRGSYNLPLKKIVISSCLQQILKEDFSQDSTLIKNPIDHHIFYPTRNGYNKNKRICMLYHTLPLKAVPEGIKAFEMTKDTYPHVQLVMFGSRPKPEHISCEFHYRPTNEELREVFNSCDIFLCPSWREGFGLPSAEAMACKCAVVTTDNGGSRDYAIHEKTALVSPPQNPEALAENLGRLLSNEDMLERVAQNGYKHIKQFTWEKAVSKMEKVFLQELKKEWPKKNEDFDLNS